MTRRRSLLTITISLAGLFLLSMAMRDPWMGHLAPGDQWTTAQTLRFLRTWHHQGALKSRLALVVSPPTAFFEGEKRDLKWGLPGHLLMLHSVLGPLGLEPQVSHLMASNLVFHLTLASVMALLAYALARTEWRQHRKASVGIALHCAAFCLLLPALLYWGQCLSCQHISIVPLLVICVAGRWARWSLPAGRRRVAMDLTVAAVATLGLITDFLFWLVVPCWIASELLQRAVRKEPRDQMPIWPLATASLGGVAVLALLFWWNQQFSALAERFVHWMTLDGPQGFELGRVMSSRLVGIEFFFKRHFLSAFSMVGVVSLGMAAPLVVARGWAANLSPRGRRVFLDLFVPTFAFTIVLSTHEAFHSFSPMKMAPFVALAWTLGVPMMLQGWGTTLNRLLRPVYVLIAFLYLLPISSGFQLYFPTPKPQWTTEGELLRTHTRPTDVVVSPHTSIGLFPPQRISLAERVVYHTPGVMDLMNLSLAMKDRNGTIAVYGPLESLPLLGPGQEPVNMGGGRAVVRFTKKQLEVYAGQLGISRYLTHEEEILMGDLKPWIQDLEQISRPLPVLQPPIGLHVTFRADGQQARRAVYWQDDDSCQFRSDGSQFAIQEGTAFHKRLGWKKLREPPGNDCAWSGLLAPLMEAERPTAKSGVSWRGLQVLEMSVAATPPSVREWAPDVENWQGWVFALDTKPLALVLLPAGSGSTKKDGPIISVVIDETVTSVALPGYVSPAWYVVKGRPFSGIGRYLPWTIIRSPDRLPPSLY